MQADELLDKGIDLYNNGEWNKALECWKKAKILYEELGDKQGISNTLGNIGLIHDNRGEWEQAIEYYKRSLKLKEELGDKQGIANTLNNIGIIHYNRGEWEQAIEYYERSLKLKEEPDDKQGIANTLNNIGIIHNNRGEWEQAIEYYERSLRLYEELGDKQGIANTLNNIGNIHNNRGEWERAIEYYERSLKLLDELGDKQGIADILNNIGEISIKNGNWDEARRNLKESLAIAENLAPICKIDALANLGELLKLEEQYDDAFTNLESALQIVNHVGAKPGEIGILEKLGDTHLDKYIFSKVEDNLSSAEGFYKQAFELASDLDIPLQKATAKRGIGIVQAKRRDLTASKESFMDSIETLRRQGARFDLQKTLLEYSKVLYESDYLFDAEMVAKASVFEAKRNNYRELLVKLYILLGDIEMKQEKQYEYYLEALKVSEFNPKIYVRTCFILIFRMKNMEKQLQLDFIKSLQELNKNKDEYFDHFLGALNAKIEGKDFETAGLPGGLEHELENFT